MPNERLKVRNETGYDTRDIRSAVLACEKYLEMVGDRFVKVVYSRNRRRSVSGYAYYPSGGREGYVVKLRLPKIRPDEAISEQLNRDFFWLVEHELSHARGVRHREMRGSSCGKVHRQERRPNWASGLQLRLKPAKTKPTMADVVAKRAEKARADLARWERKLKLAKTKVTKLRARVVYYSRTPQEVANEQPAMAAKTP